MNICLDALTPSGTGNSRSRRHFGLLRTVSDSSRITFPDGIAYESTGGFSHHFLKSPAKLFEALPSAYACIARRASHELRTHVPASRLRSRARVLFLFPENSTRISSESIQSSSSAKVAAGAACSSGGEYASATQPLAARRVRARDPALRQARSIEPAWPPCRTRRRNCAPGRAGPGSLQRETQGAATLLLAVAGVQTESKQHGSDRPRFSILLGYGRIDVRQIGPDRATPDCMRTADFLHERASS